MNYSGNMPDWHQYNPPQSGINDVTSTAQNVNSGHLSFMSSINPTCPTQLNGLNLSSEGLEKHQNDPNFNPRHFQSHLPSNIPHGHNAADSNPLASMVQMQNCISHYGPSNTRNPMVDNLNGPMDPRNAAIGGINEELGYRNNQVPLNGPISHMNAPNVMNMNAPHASIGPRNTNVNSHAASRTVPPTSFVPCKGLCCNPDPNINYQQWEKYCSYQNNTTYRETIRSSAGYQTDARRFGSEYNFRKDNFDGKEVLSSMVPPPNGPNADHRRNFPDFKYRKDRLLSRSYPPPTSGMLQNYPMQNYNYTGEYQKYPYNVKDYSKMSGMNVPNQGIVKHQEQQGFAMPQQKYNNKQVSYQTGGAIMPNSMPSTSVPNPSMMPSTQNTYFNSQYPRNLSTDASHDCQEVADNASMVNRMQTSTMHTPSHPRYRMYQQKIAMQRFSMENHLRELARIPGYQSHPKYKECVHRYREILKLQQSVTYQEQIQQTPCVATSTVNTSTIPPINLQFDQNGVLINSNYMPETFPRVQQAMNSQAPMDSPVDKQGKQDGSGVPEMANRNVQKPEQLISQHHDGHASALCAENVQKQDRYPAQKSLNQNQFEVQKTGSESFESLAGNAAMQQKISKEFANKPELDVRQFLANWDESEDEEGAGTNLPSAVLSNSTPVVVVGYENVDLSAKTLQSLEVSKPDEITSNVITFENQEKSDIVVPAQDCLTISYSAENVEIAKDPTCKDITKETIVRPGSHIIQCISNGPDEVPTIHIVDNLEIGSILQVTNGQIAETVERQGAVPFFQGATEVEAGAITLEVDKFKKADGSATKPATTEYNADLGNLSKEEYAVQGPSPSKTVESTSQTSRVSDQGIAVLPTSAKDSARDTNLKKQNSFASEESHHPDDISLPDLPTSECTPISTTLNTPIHSDNEESSEHVEDLTIPTNPIEIIQNSPMISFTQSPTKGEPYDHLNGEGTVRNKPSDSLEGEYQTENRFKNNGDDNNMLGHDVILDTFEFSTNTDKNESTTSTKSGKERANLNGISVSANNGEKVFALDDGTETVEATSMRMTLTSGEYELKIVSTGAQNKSAYKNLTSERRANEFQAANSDAHKKSQAETSAKVALRYNDSKMDNASQSVTSDPVEFDVSTEMTRQIATSRISLSPMNDIVPRSSRAEDTTQIVKSNPPASYSKKHLALDSDKLRKSEALFAKEDSISEKNTNDNRSARIDVKDPKSSRHARLADHKKSVSSDQAVSHKKRCLSENMAERCGETIVHHNKHTQEAATHKDKSCIENPKGSDNSRNKPKVIENISIVDNGERMRLLKEYRRIKYKSLSIGEVHDKGKDTQEASDYAASKKCRRSSNPVERSASQSPCDKQLCQKDVARPEEQEGKHASILKTFVTKNINPDFAIQVTNVNLKLKDDDHQKGLQHLREEAKSSGSLDAIKIEINVSCTERNTTEKLLHENIKNAVAETIGHLTNSISNGARSNSTSITEIQCDKKMVCDKVDRRDYEKRNRSPSPEASAYNEAHEDHNNTEMKLKSTMIVACKEDTNSETLASKKRRSSLLEQELINDVYEDSGNVNTETELAASALKTSRSEHSAVRRRSVHQDEERNVAATSSFCSEELKASSDNSPYLEPRNINVQKKQHQETTSCRSARNLQDNATTRLSAVPSTSSGTVEPMEDASYDNLVHFDYNHFDVAPNENTDASDRRADRWKRPKRDDGRFGNFDLYETTVSGYVNPTFFSADEMENLNTVPVYTTKDGKITYSPNPRFTYRELIMEARAKDGYDNREPYFARSPSYDYYNCSKLRKVFKRNRDVTTTGRKREIDPVDAKPAAKHVDYLPNKNAAHKSANCAKTRGTSHLEFFNDDADKLYANKSGQESKENNKKNIVDLDFLEKQYNLDSEPASSIKQCKTKVFPDNLEYEKGYNENSVFDSNLFLEPRAACWEETMESIKSYSSHIDRRNIDNIKELNFSEIFAAQKRLDPFPFLSVEQDSSDNGNRKANCDVTNEPMLHPTTCNYTEDLHLIRDDDLRYEQSGVASCNEQENECENQNNASANVKDKPVSILNTSLNMQSNDEHIKKQESQFDGEESSVIEFAKRARSCSPKIADEKIHGPEEDQCSTSYVKDKEALTEHLAEDDSHLRCTVSPKEDKSDAEIANTKEVLDEETAKVASPSKSNIEFKDSLEELKNTEIAKESALTSNERDNEINDSAKDDSDSVVNRETVYQQILSASADHKDKEEIAHAMESNVSAEINFDQTDEQDTYDKENSAVSKEDEPIALQNPSDVAFAEQTLDKEDNEQQSGRLENDEQKDEVSLKDQGNDEVDSCCPMIISTPAAALNLQTEENVCDLFACERREQNISEFTVIKNIIKGNKQQESETIENPKDCDSIIDSKLLCMDSSDCGIYAEGRCALVQMSEHDFTEDDSMVPMVWETSQIQEDAVNAIRLCNIESSIDFTGAVNSLQDNSLLDQLSLSRMSAIKEPRAAEIITEIESNAIIESAAAIEESKATPSNDENKEQNQNSSSSYEKIAYLRATDCNANTKIVPKLVIKKSETSSKFVTKGSPSVTQDSLANNKSVCQPKIPKMIIRNARSRPGTPSIEAVHEETPAQTNISDRTSLTNEELCESNSESSLQESNRNKIPKMKIKLDEKHSNKIVRTDDAEEVCVKRKNIKKTIPKVKIKSTSRSDLTDDSVCNSIISQESDFSRDSGRYEEKIPILKLRKRERNRSSSPEVTRKRQSSSHSEVLAKRYKRSRRDETEHPTRRSNSSDSTRTNVSECKTKKNSSVRTSEKIPKVIIKRTSASAEFKCELSKGCKNVIAMSAKWQPEVKLERYRILDNMVKDLKLTLSPITLRAIDKISASRRDSHRQEKQSDYKLSRSNSTSKLLPAKSKQRRMSDYDCRKISDASRIDENFAPSRDTDSRDTKTCTTPKKNPSSRGCKSIDECQKDNKRRSRSRDNNPRAEADVTSSDKEINRSSEKSNSQKTTSQCDKQKTDSFDINREQADEDTISNKLGQKNTPAKHSSSSNFKLALKELKATSKIETCFMKLPGPSETLPEEVNLQTDEDQRKERDDDPFLSKDDGKVMIKKELLSSSSDMDNDCTLQDNIDLLKDDSANMLDNFEVINSTVIKVESSDESQSTIEILPASPDDNHSELERHMIEEGDSEQLYSADAIPTQFELELEITDNSNTDLLDVCMPKLDPITCYSSRRASAEESSDQTAKLGCYNKSEASSRGKNSLGKDKRIVEIDISGDDRSALENSSAGSVGEVSPKSPCCKATGFAATRENFCCNDSLIKAVLAAKETLKKCLSKSRYDVQSSAIGNARPKTAAEKKQGLSFDIKTLPEAPSSDASQGCHSDIAPQKSPTPVANKHNKTENISNVEKSDKKHSKQNKSSSVKKKPRSPEKNEADLKEMVKDTPECTTISLKTFKQLGQPASNESHTVHLNEKRKNLTGRSDDVLHSQDPKRREKDRMSSYKIPKISRSTDQKNNSNAKETKPKEDNMPILQPEVDVNFDTNSDRESSRSPPVITIQDGEDLGIAESKLVDDKVITSSIKVESNTKDVHKKSEMSIVDFITQLAYHEKATIKHRRYCNLCERWFPTTSRHRRHLAGYQHRHIELTQRRSIHALFTLFTGKPCPRLVPANVVRSDCSVGELTPLQIAVQDVTKCFDRTQQSPRKENDVDK